MAVLECRLKPWTHFAWNEPNKNGFLTWKHLLSEPLAKELSCSQVPALKRSGKPQVLLCKCFPWNKTEALLRAKMKYICLLFIYSEPHNLPISLYITRCLGKNYSATIFVTQESQAYAFVSLWESMKHSFSVKLSVRKSIWRRPETSDPSCFRSIPV